jgi:hypothetical protein
MAVGVVSIGGHTYPVDLAQSARRPITQMRAMQDQGTEVGEQSLDNTALWRRKQDDFVFGQGQPFFDQSDESNRRRVRAISGFDPLANRRALAVAPTCTAGVVTAYAGGTAGSPKLLKTRSNWWAIPTATGVIKRTASLTSFTTTNVTGTTAATDATVFGDTVYIADGSSVFSGSITGSSVSSFSTVDTDVLDAVKGRLVAGHDNELFELDSAGAKIEVFTHPNTSWDWYDFAGGNVGIYAAGHDGLKSEIYLITVIDATGALQAPSPVAELPAGELVRAIDYFGGFLVIGTSRGVRIAQASQSGLLSYGPLIELGDVKGVAFEDRFAYVTCSAFPTFGGPGVVKLSMDRFVSSLVPAYAGSFPVNASGYTAFDVGVADSAVVCLLGNLTNIQVAATAASYGSADAYSGQITFGTDEPKNVQSAEVVFDALTSGQSVTLSIYDRQGGSQLTTGTTNTVGATSLTLEGFSEILRESYEIRLQATGQVIIRRWTTRAVVAPSRIPEEIILGLMLARSVKLDGGQTVQLDPYVEWQYLLGLMSTRTKVDMVFGDETAEVWVDQVGVDGSWNRWDPGGHWPDGVVAVRLVTIQ